jgi:hypothetical protein
MRTQQHTDLQTSDDEIEQRRAVGVRQAGDGQNIRVQPTRQHGHIVGQRDRLGLPLGGDGDLATQRLELAPLIATALPLQLGLIVRELGDFSLNATDLARCRD